MAAHAQTALVQQVGLEWVRATGAEACIDATELAQRVEQRLGHAVFSQTSEALVTIDGTVGPASEHGFRAIIRVRGADGTLYGSREVSVPDPDCRKLDDVVALIISVTLRHEGVGGIPLPESVTNQLDGKVEPEPAPEPTAVPDEPLAAADSSRTWKVQLEAGLGVATGLATSASFAPTLRVQLELLELFSLGVEGRIALTQTQRVTSEPRGSLHYRSHAFALLGCVLPLRAATIALALCADARVDYLSVEPQDFAYTYGASARWLELALAASLRAALLGPTFAHLRLGVPWRVNRPQFKYESSQGDLRDAFRMTPFALDLSLSLGVEF